MTEHGRESDKEQERSVTWNAEQERNAYLLTALQLFKETTEEHKDRLVKEQIEQGGQIQPPTPDELRTVF